MSPVNPSRHYTGRPMASGAGVWVCPTCRSENVGTVDDGCGNPECPTRQAQARKGEPQQQGSGRPSSVSSLVHDEAAAAAWDAWSEGRPSNPAIRDAFFAGWESGLAYGGGQGEAPPTGGPVTPTLSLSLGDHPVDDPTRDTILAALAFYRDNTLAFGPIPGQLTAQQVTDLLSQLTPKDEEEGF